ncbi:uncharacterized protein METZ01_LOCUS226966, partial [marine metagenome]
MKSNQVGRDHRARALNGRLYDVMDEIDGL